MQQPFILRNHWYSLIFTLALLLAVLLSGATPTPALAAAPGAVVAWGCGDPFDWGQCNVPLGLNDVTAVARGGSHSLALRDDGTVVAWGCGDPYNAGQCNVPADLGSVIAIAGGSFHSLALKSNGTVVAWGCGIATFNYGQCTVPAGLNGVVSIAAGAFHSLALKSDGTVVAWGSNNEGELNIPAGLSNVTAISAAGFTNLVLKNDGTVAAWGCLFTNYGQCTVPTDLSDVTAIAAGDFHSLALKSDGTVVAWGRNNERQSNVPAGLSGVTAIAGGVYHSLALKHDGTVVVWGNNSYGQLNVPPALSGVTAIAAGTYHSLVITTDSTPPSVTINQAAGQADPTNASPVNFTAVFNEPVYGFTGSAVALSGTAGAVTAVVSGGPTTFNIAVSGMTTSGTVIASIPTGAATDLAGNGNTASTSSDNSITFNADSTGPVITPSVMGTMGNNGWYVSNVSVSWRVVDNESTVANQSGCTAQNITSDTRDVTFTCSATSAGGSSSQSVTIKRDATAPTITFVNRTAANGNGWNNTDVAVNWSCSDTTSDVVAASVNQTVNGEGANQSATGACIDKAGNSATNTQSGINIDKTPPTISAAATTQPNANNWYNSDVAVHFTCADALSKLATNACPADQVLNSEGAAIASTAQTVSDLAGNSSTASNVVTVRIDKTAPTISAAATTQPNANGWYNSNVTIHFTCSDNLSTVVTCPADAVLSSEGSAVASTAQTVRDAAGNPSQPSNVVTVAIDKTAPVVAVTGVSNGVSYTLGSVPTAGCSTSDALSAVATQATLSVTDSNPDGTGTFTATCSGATDKAGNPGNASATYSVAYNWTGFFQPVDNLPTINTVNAGQAIPVKFSLGGDYGLTIFATGYPASQNVSCGSGGSGGSDPIEETVTAGSSSLQYDPGAQRYIYVWKTDKAWAGTCRTLIVKLIDGTEHSALFQFTGKARSANASDTEGHVAAAQQQIFLPVVSR